MKVKIKIKCFLVRGLKFIVSQCSVGNSVWKYFEYIIFYIDQ